MRGQAPKYFFLEPPLVEVDVALNDTPSQSYRTSLAMGFTQYYLPPDASERAPPNPSHTGWYSIYLYPLRDGRLS